MDCLPLKITPQHIDSLYEVIHCGGVLSHIKSLFSLSGRKEEKMKAKSFILYLDNKILFDDLTDEEAGKLIKAIFEYESIGKVIQLDRVLKMAFNNIKLSLDRNSEKYENVCERNRENALKRWNTKNTSGTNRIPKNTKNAYNDSDSKNDNKSNNEKEKNILLFLNQTTNRNFKPVKSNLSIITARLNEGFTEEDFKKVILTKTKQWGKDEKMKQYLRPDTLFRPNNFQAYLNQNVEIEESEDEINDRYKAIKWYKPEN